MYLPSELWHRILTGAEPRLCIIYENKEAIMHHARAKPFETIASVLKEEKCSILRFLVTDLDLGYEMFREFPHGIDGAILYAAHCGNIECLKFLMAERDPGLFGSRASDVCKIPLLPSFPLSACNQGVFKSCLRDFCLGTEAGVEFWRTTGSVWVQRSDDAMLESLPGKRWPDNACTIVAGMGNTACLRYLRDNGYGWDVLTLACAARGGQKDCLKYAHENGCPGLIEVATDAFDSGDSDCMQYILDTLCRESSPYFWHRFMERKRRFNPLLLSHQDVTGTVLNIQRNDYDRKKINVLDRFDINQPGHEKEFLPLSDKYTTRSTNSSLEIRDCSMFPGRSFMCDTTDLSLSC